MKHNIAFFFPPFAFATQAQYWGTNLAKAFVCYTTTAVTKDAQNLTGFLGGIQKLKSDGDTLAYISSTGTVRVYDNLAPANIRAKGSNTLAEVMVSISVKANWHLLKNQLLYRWTSTTYQAVDLLRFYSHYKPTIPTCDDRPAAYL